MVEVQITLSPTNIIPMSVPDEQFVAEADVLAISQEIPGTNTVGSMLPSGGSYVATGSDLNPDGSSKRKLLSITFDQTRWPNAKFAEPAFKPLEQKKAMVAAGKLYTWKEGADGYPAPAAIPVVVPAPVGQPGAGSFMPSPQESSVELKVDRLIRFFNIP